MKELINLFRAVPILKVEKKEPSKELLKKTIKRGFVFAPEVIANYSDSELDLLILEIEKIIGLDGAKLNNTFHKSWRKVRNERIELLLLEQLVNYITTYGFENMGIYNESTIYIPQEKLNLPKIKLDKIPLVVIKGYTKDEFREKMFNILSSGIALTEDTINDIVKISSYLGGINQEEISEIKNKEIRVILFDKLNVIPKNATEFLRFCVYKVTNKTLLIKDNETIDKIKNDKNFCLIDLFNKYSNEHGLEKLAEIFLRFKPLFLSFRTNFEMKRIINKVRKLAKKHHKPMEEDYLNNVTGNLKKKSLDLSKLKVELEKANIFRKARLAYALKFRFISPESIMYRIRNGKSFITDFDKTSTEGYEIPLNMIIDSISNDLRGKVEGKKIYIPSSIKYTIPTTEKQFIGNFPSGTSVTVPKNMIFGIHWNDLEHRRIDLDLSLIDMNGMRIGWNTSYRHLDNGDEILFSGDQTAAPLPNGASELFFVKTNATRTAMLFVNNYTYYEKIEVPFEIIVSESNGKSFSRNYMVSPNDIISIDRTKISSAQKILGLLVTDPNECKFYYVDTALFGSIVARNDDMTIKSRQFLFDFYHGSIYLHNVLFRAGAILVDSKDDCDLDLSPENLQKDTIINLLTKK